MTRQRFVQEHYDLLNNYWFAIEKSILDWKSKHNWQNVALEDAVAIRNSLEEMINKDLRKYGYVSKKTVDEVMIWGFGSRRVTTNTEEEIINCTKRAFDLLYKEEFAEAALELTKLNNMGISGASKLLALSDQTNLGIYDSRSAHGISDLVINGKSLLLIPPGRSTKVTGDANLPQVQYCYSFQVYTWVLQFLRDKALLNPNLNEHFKRVADIEIAYFARSRAGLI
jgi:hypothetical protein